MLKFSWWLRNVEAHVPQSHPSVDALDTEDRQLLHIYIVGSSDHSLGRLELWLYVVYTILLEFFLRVTLKLTVRDKWNKPVLVQQAFVRVANERDETIFVAEPDNTKAYKVELVSMAYQNDNYNIIG